MGRGKVELKRIENNISRQVTFSKRRHGLFKKAFELSVLCDAEIALIVFSARGRLYHFTSSNNIGKTIERYQRCCGGTIGPLQQDSALACDLQSWSQELSRLKAKYESLKRQQRQLLGEDLGALNVKELLNLEKQLERALTQARHRKTQLMTEQMEALRKKERQLSEFNLELKQQVGEQGQYGMMRQVLQGSWPQSSNTMCGFACDSSSLQPYKPEPVLQIGCPPYGDQEEEGPSNTRGSPTELNFPQSWLL